MPPVYNTHTPSYIYNIYPLMEHHPKKPQLCRNTLFIPTFFLISILFRLFVSNSSWTRRLLSNVRVSNVWQKTKQKTNDHIDQQFVTTKPSSPRPPQKIGKHFSYLVSWGYTFFCFVQSDPATGWIRLEGFLRSLSLIPINIPTLLWYIHVMWGVLICRDQLAT
jgi:hypothetical protein